MRAGGAVQRGFAWRALAAPHSLGGGERRPPPTLDATAKYLAKSPTSLAWPVSGRPLPSEPSAFRPGQRRAPLVTWHQLLVFVRMRSSSNFVCRDQYPKSCSIRPPRKICTQPVWTGYPHPRPLGRAGSIEFLDRGTIEWRAHAHLCRGHERIIGRKGVGRQRDHRGGVGQHHTERLRGTVLDVSAARRAK